MKTKALTISLHLELHARSHLVGNNGTNDLESGEGTAKNYSEGTIQYPEESWDHSNKGYC